MPEEPICQRSPLPADPCLLPLQAVSHVGAYAIDVDMKLVLRASLGGVYGEAGVFGRQRAVQAAFDEPALLPRLRKIVLRIRRQDGGAVDAGDSRCRDEKVLRRSPDVLQHGVSAPDAVADMDGGAGVGSAGAQSVGDAFAVDDVPQRVRIGGMRRGRREAAYPKQQCTRQR